MFYETKEKNHHLLISRTHTDAYRQILSNLKKYDHDVYTKLFHTIHSNKNKYYGNLDMIRNELFMILRDYRGIDLHAFKYNSDDNTLCVSIYFDFDYICYWVDLDVNQYDYICKFMWLISPICLPANDMYFDYDRTRFICFNEGHISETWANLVYDGRRCDKESCLYNYYGNCSYQKIHMRYPAFDSSNLCKELMAKTK